MKNVLLVEDDEDIRDCLLEGIESSMYNIICACDGIEALEILHSKKIDLVITDYKMPRMDGARFSIKAKQSHPEIPILLISTFCPFDLGVQDVVHSYIPKPFDPETLKIIIENILFEETVV